jgi:hypothetical protein
MTRALAYDCFSGISGDMHLGALLDLGLPEAVLRDGLARLGVAGEFTLQVEPGQKHGISGTKATVRLREGVERPHRHLADVLAIIASGGYAPGIVRRAEAIFREIAVAEARIHGIDIEEVHFHEVGATDSIVDIVGAAIGLEHLGIGTAYCHVVELGGGMLRCAHGVFPVPAPATAEILRGVPCRYGGTSGEATTPTGAAILKATVQRFALPAGFVAERVGYGVGQKDFAIPNVLRVLLGSDDATQAAAAGESPHYVTETNLQVECNIDDMSPEAFAPLLTQLFAAGALDVFLTPVLMKKSRPGTQLTLLCPPQRLDAVRGVLFGGSTTIGIRVHEVRKHMLPREARTLDTAHGSVRVKVVTLADGRRHAKCEHDDVAALATRNGLDYLTQKRLLDAEVVRLLGDVQPT